MPRSMTTPSPLVRGAGVIVPREGTPAVLPLSLPTEESVGEGAVGLTPGPDWLLGEGEL
jgi:hypothetical protein